MIGFDNAIEVAITTYLNLHPIQRGNRTYPGDNIEKWLANYHSKIEFFFLECGTRAGAVIAEKDVIIWYHQVRNGQYHIGGATVPQRRELDGARAAAHEVFSILFEESNLPALLEAHIVAANPQPPPRTDEHDRLIDSAFRMINVCGRPEYVSEVLYRLDPDRYREMALELLSGDRPEDLMDDSGSEGE
jgi:hypothetical protein